MHHNVYYSGYNILKYIQLNQILLLIHRIRIESFGICKVLTVFLRSSSSVLCTFNNGVTRTSNLHQGQSRTAKKRRTFLWIHRTAKSWSLRCDSLFRDKYPRHPACSCMIVPVSRSSRWASKRVSTPSRKKIYKKRNTLVLYLLLNSLLGWWGHLNAYYNQLI